MSSLFARFINTDLHICIAESFVGANVRINGLPRFRINFRILNFVCMSTAPWHARNIAVRWPHPMILWVVSCSKITPRFDLRWLSGSDGERTPRIPKPLLAKNFYANERLATRSIVLRWQ